MFIPLLPLAWGLGLGPIGRTIATRPVKRRTLEGGRPRSDSSLVDPQAWSRG